jgi:hypothetical protein
MFGNNTKTTIVPAGYKPDLDRLPPEEHTGAGKGCLWVLVLVGLLGGVVLVGLTLVAQPTEETETASILFETSPTALDEWSLMGTKFYFDTLTPRATEEATEEATITLTPFGADWNTITPIKRIDLMPTATVSPTNIPTSTLLPKVIPPARVEYVDREVIVISTVVVIQEVEKIVEKPIIQEVEKIVVITATNPPPTPTMTHTVTPTATASPTNTASPTATASPTNTASPTTIPTSTLLPLPIIDPPPEVTTEVNP